MQLPILVPLIALCIATSAHAYDAAPDRACGDAASRQCPNMDPPHNIDNWMILYFRCRSAYWRSLPTDDKCPYPKLGCRCYNGCVKDVWSIKKDVGQWCHNACDLGNKTPGACT
ncbi:hypothetical protein V8E36_006820 [Tilletia maclaganii]